MNPYTISRRNLIKSVPAFSLALGLSAGPARFAFAQDATPLATVPSEWAFYGADLSGSRSIASAIDSSTVTGLNPSWSVDIGGPISATPVTAGGIVYAGSYDGNLYALDLATGASVWTYPTGATVMEPNLKIPLGITGSAAVADGVVYVGDSAATVHAVDAATGEAIWVVKVDDQESASIWSSPVIWKGMLVVGVASVAKEDGFRGSVVALDTDMGNTLWQTYMVPEGADGAGVFDVPTIDPDRNLVFAGTQNAYTEAAAPYGNPTSVVALDATSGKITWVYSAPPNDEKTAPTDDVAFSASPNLFSVEQDGQTLDLVGIGQKSGVYWALNRDTGKVVWQQQISPAGFLGGMEGTAAVSNGVIAVPATDWPDFNGPASGLVIGLDAVTGAVLWTAREDAPAASPASITNDVVFHAGIDGVLHAFGLTDGTELWNSDLGASVSSGIAVSGDTVVLGAGTPAFAPMVKTGNTIRAFSLGAPAVSPAASPVAPPSVGGTPLPAPTEVMEASPSPVA